MNLPPRLAAGLERLFQRPVESASPHTLGPRRIYLLPTPSGLTFALLLVAMLVGAINYGLALGYALVFLLTGVGLVTLIHTAATLWGLTWQASPGAPVFAGDTATFYLTLSHRDRRPRPDLEITARGNHPTTGGTLAPGQSLRFAVGVHGPARGWLPQPLTEIRSRYPLGWFTAWALIRPDVRCLIYPRPLWSPLPAGGGTDGLPSRPSPAGDEDYAGLRERTPADPLRHVAWKLAARDPEAPLRVVTHAGGPSANLDFTWDDLHGHDPETRLSLLTGWVLQASEAGHRYSLRLPGLHLPAAAGEAHRQHCLETLACYTP